MKRWQNIVVWLLFSSIKDDTKTQMSEDVKKVEDSGGKTRKRIEWKYTGEKQIPKRKCWEKRSCQCTTSNEAMEVKKYGAKGNHSVLEEIG